MNVGILRSDHLRRVDFFQEHPPDAGDDLLRLRTVEEGLLSGRGFLAGLFFLSVDEGPDIRVLRGEIVDLLYQLAARVVAHFGRQLIRVETTVPAESGRDALAKFVDVFLAPDDLLHHEEVELISPDAGDCAGGTFRLERRGGFLNPRGVLLGFPAGADLVVLRLALFAGPVE